MNRNKLLPLAVLGGVVALLLAALLALNALHAAEPADDPGIALFAVDTDSITALACQDDESEAALHKSGDAWVLDSDAQLPIDGDKVDQVLASLTGMTALRALAEEEVDADALGFDAPAMAFSFTAGDGEHTLLVGDQNAMAGAYYVQADGRLYTVNTSVFVGLCKTPRQLYKAQSITDIETTDVATLTLDTGGETLTFARDADGNWTLRDDAAFALDQDKVSRMASTICTLQSAWSITAPAADSAYGLDAPNAIVTLTATDGRSVRCVFGTTGIADDGSEIAYLRASGDESVVYEVAANHLDAFAYTKAALRAETETAETATAGTASSANG